LVVARYDEAPQWLKNIPPAWKTFIYDKGRTRLRGSLCLPNIGREAHTYLYHIITHYHALADLTVFVQGHPFDHFPRLHPFLRETAANPEAEPDFRWLGFFVDQDDPHGRRLFVPWSKNSTGQELPTGEIFQRVTGLPPPELFTFYGGAHFVVRRERVQRLPLAYYERALMETVRHPLAAHAFERFWDRFFQVDGIPPEMKKGPYPVYLKTIRRLMAGDQASSDS
jgi:hypothetical protein